MITFNDVEMTLEEFEIMLKSEASHSVEVKKNSPPMSKLNYRFGESVPKKCELIASNYEQFNQSDIARSAIAIGLNEIKKAMEISHSKGKGLIYTGKLRHDFL